MDAAQTRAHVRWDGDVLRAGRWPVYVDFADSILDRDALLATAGRSPVRRRAGLRGRVREAIRRLTAPAEVSRRNVERFVELLMAENATPAVLVIGGGQVGLGAERLYDDPAVRVLAFDIYASPHVQMIADAHAMPFRDACVDAVLVQAVLEHVLDPWRVVAEIHRVLRPEGLVYAETPFLQHVHEGAYDFTRFTESGHRWLFREFSRVDSGAVTGPGVQLIWTVEHLARSLSRSNAIGQLAKLAVFWAKYLDRLIAPPHAVDGACGVYFLGRRAERPLPPSEMRAHYGGAQG